MLRLLLCILAAKNCTCLAVVPLSNCFYRGGAAFSRGWFRGLRLPRQLKGAPLARGRTAPPGGVLPRTPTRPRSVCARRFLPGRFLGRLWPPHRPGKKTAVLAGRGLSPAGRRGPRRQSRPRRPAPRRGGARLSSRSAPSARESGPAEAGFFCAVSGFARPPGF